MLHNDNCECRVPQPKVFGIELNNILIEFGKNPTGDRRNWAYKEIRKMFRRRDKEIRIHERSLHKDKEENE